MEITSLKYVELKKNKKKKWNMVSVTCHFNRLNARQLFAFPMYFFLNAVKHKKSNNCNLILNCHHNYSHIHLKTKSKFVLKSILFNLNDVKK